VNGFGKDEQPTVAAVDLFCGAGGLTYGLRKAGINVRLGVDLDGACEYPYTANNDAEFMLKSVTDLKSEEVNVHFADSDFSLLAGCAPCQTFSTYNQKATSDDERWWLLQQFSRLIKETKPDLVTMENVPGLMDEAVFDEFAAALVKDDYHVDSRLVRCEEYGLPQYRRRLVLLASKLGSIQVLQPDEFRKHPKKKTVEDTISKLPAIAAGGCDAKDRLHQSADLSETNMRRMVASTPGGTWRDWPDDLIAGCHKRRTGKTYPSVYGRMRWDEPAPTMTTQFYGFGNGRFGHPTQNRAISLREGAMLQSFPKGYKFVRPGDPICRKTLGRLIGNAVPVRLGQVIGESIIRHLQALGAGEKDRCCHA
jgi:DNA (cytosine-5)-methyltransferase 1